MHARPSISFVVPAYNVASYLDECLSSIVTASQVGDQLILINDGSTDQTGALCRQWAALHPRLITLLEQHNLGLSVARNNGLQLSTCPYVLFMDSDDVVQTAALTRARGILASQAPDILVMDFCWWHPERHQPFNRAPACSHPARTYQSHREAFCIQTFLDNRLSACSRIFKRDLLAQLAPDVFPPGDAYEEIATVPRLTLRAQSLYYLNEVLFYYRIRPGSITQTKKAKQCLDLSKAMTTTVHEVRSLGLSDEVEMAANMAAANLMVSAIRDCGLVIDDKTKLYERVLEQGMATLSLPVPKIVAALKHRNHATDRKTAKHLQVAQRFPKFFLASRRWVYNIKRQLKRRASA
ncbi:glycosyltransferase family 2 protein [Aquabacterium sp. G14]|uniref:glycosyltransferase family 2 protein n=1 Tax=Aquabacterium sp. G14 TaxID=3130164 RepID=UPI0030AA3BEF